MNYFAKIKYLGRDFHGFQVQPEKRTVQGTLCEALSRATGVPCKVTGCSRTDSGVHANEFCIRVDAVGATVPANKLPVAVAKYLPPDLSLYYAEECAEDFHPRYDVRSKEYLYVIKNEPVYDPFYYGRAWFISRPITDEGYNEMVIAAEKFIGKKDFSSFVSEGADTDDFVREIYYLNLEKTGSTINIRIAADGFLYNMVRIIVGTLIDVAFFRKSPLDVEKIIEAKDRSLSGMTAPPDGLYLNKVNY
ncbi:MAG: tRNA pseudouridine(38-40) synthase TruA [Clostridia bacterium]|nr:tRNA pseudouridine(38-40) synthase TruA [Clostridia bacterium]